MSRIANRLATVLLWLGSFCQAADQVTIGHVKDLPLLDPDISTYQISSHNKIRMTLGTSNLRASA